MADKKNKKNKKNKADNQENEMQHNNPNVITSQQRMIAAEKKGNRVIPVLIIIVILIALLVGITILFVNTVKKYDIPMPIINPDGLAVSIDDMYDEYGEITASHIIYGGIKRENLPYSFTTYKQGQIPTIIYYSYDGNITTSNVGSVGEI